MASYRGPHVAVYQKFDTSAPGVAVEDLPSVSVASSYEVYEKEYVGTHKGVFSSKNSWLSVTDNTPIISGVLSDRDYDFYPVKTFVSTPYGDIATNALVSEDGIETGKDDTYTIPGLDFKPGTSSAVIPFYNQTTNIVVNTSNQNIITIDSGYVKSAGIVSGQRVFLESASTGRFYAGSVEGTPSSEGSIRISKSAPAGVYTSIIIGAKLEAQVKDSATIDTTFTPEVPGSPPAPATLTFTVTDLTLAADDRVYVNGVFAGLVKTASSSVITIEDPLVTSSDTGTTISKDGAFNSTPNTLYDEAANFFASRVKVGDLVKFNVSSQDYTATVKNIVNNNTIFFETGTADDGDYYSYKSAKTYSSGTDLVESYSVNRLIGYSKPFGEVGTMETVSAGTPAVVVKNKIKVEVADTVGYEFRIGDLISLGISNKYKYEVLSSIIDTVGASSKTYIITLNKEYDEAAGVKCYAFRVVESNDVIVTFRAMNDSANKVPVRITSINDIVDNFGDISPYNELAFMLSTQYSLSGGNVVYGVNVFPASNNGGVFDLYSEYSEALEALKNLDVYSHAFGTTSPSINGTLIPAYVIDQADPYMGHERIATCSWNEDDILYIGKGSVGSWDGKNIVISSGVDITVEVKLRDEVIIEDANNSGQYVVISTPEPDGSVDIEYVSGFEFPATATLVDATFYTGNPSDQADRIADIGTNNRRVTDIFPGWYTAEYDGITKEFPPYFIAAVVTGLDSGKLVSQSFTNMPTAIPGMSNYRLNTSTRFSKSDLDVIGGGGVDVMVQGAPVTQNFVSRHDLTSNMDAIEYRERSITKQVDVCAKTHRNAILPYVGRYNVTDSLLEFIRQLVVNVNNALIKAQTIKEISLVSVERDKDIADKINIILNVTVFVAGNYYEITLNVKS